MEKRKKRRTTVFSVSSRIVFSLCLLVCSSGIHYLRYSLVVQVKLTLLRYYHLYCGDAKKTMDGISVTIIIPTANIWLLNCFIIHSMVKLSLNRIIRIACYSFIRAVTTFIIITAIIVNEIAKKPNS